MLLSTRAYDFAQTILNEYEPKRAKETLKKKIDAEEAAIEKEESTALPPTN